MTERREMVDHPRHYNAHPSGVECIEICEHMTFNLGNAFKYGWRYRDKGDEAENLKKMLWYVERSRTHDTSFLTGDTSYRRFFRDDVMAMRKHVFDRPSPWCEPVRHAMAAICELHTPAGIGDAIRLYKKIETCINQALTDELCLTGLAI